MDIPSASDKDIINYFRSEIPKPTRELSDKDIINYFNEPTQEELMGGLEADKVSVAPNGYTGTWEESPVEKAKDTIFSHFDTPEYTTMEAIKEAVPRLPENVLTSVAKTFQGQKGASVADRGWIDNFINWVDDRNSKLSEKYEGKGDFIPGLITKQDVVDTINSLPYSATVAGASLLGGAGGAIAGAPIGPGATITAGAGALLAGGTAAYRMDAYSFMNELLENVNQVRSANDKDPMTMEEEDKFKKDMSSVVTKHALWEAGPEGVGTTGELILLGIQKMPGVKTIPKPLRKKIISGVTRFAGVLATEQATETVTQHGQQRLESDLGLTKEAPRSWTDPKDIKKSAKEVAPQVALMVGMMGGGSAMYHRAAKAKSDLAGIIPEEVKPIKPTKPDATSTNEEIRDFFKEPVEPIELTDIITEPIKPDSEAMKRFYEKPVEGEVSLEERDRLAKVDREWDKLITRKPKEIKEESPVVEEVIDEALTDEELEIRLEKTTVPKIKAALKAEVKERKRLDKKIDELPETVVEEEEIKKREDFKNKVDEIGDKKIKDLAKPKKVEDTDIISRKLAEKFGTKTKIVLKKHLIKTYPHLKENEDAFEAAMSEINFHIKCNKKLAVYRKKGITEKGLKGLTDKEFNKLWSSTMNIPEVNNLTKDESEAIFKESSRRTDIKSDLTGLDYLKEIDDLKKRSISKKTTIEKELLEDYLKTVTLPKSKDILPTIKYFKGVVKDRMEGINFVLKEIPNMSVKKLLDIKNEVKGTEFIIKHLNVGKVIAETELEKRRVSKAKKTKEFVADISKEFFSTDIVKPQDTITRTELRKMFAPMKNVVTGVNKKGNMYFKVRGKDPVEIKEVDYIAGNINTIAGPIPVGSYLDNVIKLKVKGKGVRAGSSTAWHEFMHYIETNGIITDNDIKLLDDVIDKEDVTFEDRATYVGNNLADFKSQKSSLVRRAFRKIADFVNAIREMIKKTRTAKGVLRDIRTGKILKGKPSKVQVQEKELYHKKTAYKESLEPISESDYEKNRDLSKPRISKIVNKVLKEPKDLTKQPDKFFGMISTRLNKICPELMAKTRELEFNKGVKISRRTKRIKPFLKVQKKMQKKNMDDFSDFGYALANSDINKVNELIDKYKIHKEYREMDKLLKELYNEGLDVGLELGVVNYYFPRGVSDSKGLVEEIRGSKDWDIYSRALEEKALGTNMVVSEMHPDLKASIIANTLEINSTGLGGITSTKHRKYKKIPGDLYAKFYMNQMETLTNHVIQMTTLIENRRFLGKVPKRISEKRRKLAHAQSQIKECNDNMSGKLSTAQTKRLERFKKLVKDNKADKKTLINAKQHIRGLNIILGNKLSDKNIEILQARKNKHIRVEKQCDSYLQKYAAEHKDGIGQVINKLIESGELKPEHEQEAHDMLHSLVNPGSMYGGWATLRNIGYISVMANPLSAVTQMEDLRYPLYISPLGFPKHLFKAITGISKIKREMVGLDKKISQEFSDAATTSKAVTKLFKYVGITLVDAIGKDVTLNAAYDNYRKRAKKNPSKFKNDIKVYFKEETDGVIDDLNNDNITENVLKLVYYRLLDFQPVAATETSEYYQKANNLTGIYMLKTYDLKALDVVRNEVYNKIKSGSVKEAVEGVSNLMRLATTFFICGVPRKMIQFWILGKAIDMEDIAYERLMGLFFASKYTLKQIKREGIINVFTEWLLPPTEPWTSMFRDVSDIYHDKWKGSEVVKNIPFLGKLYYYRFGKFAGNKDVKSGRSMRRSTARKGIARRGTARRSQ